VPRGADSSPSTWNWPSSVDRATRERLLNEEDAFHALFEGVNERLVQHGDIIHIPASFANAMHEWSNQHWMKARAAAPNDFAETFVTTLWVAFHAGRQFQVAPFPFEPCSCGIDHDRLTGTDTATSDTTTPPVMD